MIEKRSVSNNISQAEVAPYIFSMNHDLHQIHSILELLPWKSSSATTEISTAVESGRREGIQNRDQILDQFILNGARQQNTDRAIKLVGFSCWATRNHTATVGTSPAICVRSSSSGVIKELLFEE